MLRYFIYLSGYLVFSYVVNALPCPVLNGLDSPQPLHSSNKTIPECSVNANGLDGSSIQNITFGILTVCLALASLIVGYLHYRRRDGLIATGTPYSRSDTQLEGEAALFFQFSRLTDKSLDTPLPHPELNVSSPSNMTPLRGYEVGTNSMICSSTTSTPIESQEGPYMPTRPPGSRFSFLC